MAKATENKAQDAVDTAADGVRTAANKTADAVHDSVGAAQEQVAAGLHYASSAAAGFNDNAARTVKRYPVRTVLVVAAIGVITGFIVGVATANRS